MSEATTELSVVIPVCNSEGTLRPLLERTLAVLQRIGRPFEVVFIDDGSRDESWKILQELHQAHPDCVVAVRLMRNYGQDNALMCGFRHARGEFIITMDDDLQHPPEEIPRLLEEIEGQELDLVYGVYREKQHSLVRNLGSRLIMAFFRRVFRTRATITSFRVIRRVLVESVFTYNLNFTIVDGLFFWNTTRVGEVMVDHHPRSEGRSSYRLGSLLLLAFNAFTNFSLLPLQLITFVGLVVALFGFGLALYYFAQAFTPGWHIPGYASMIVSILTLGGLQMMALGILGEYLGRLHINVNRKPQYRERSVLERTPPSFGGEASAITVAPGSPSAPR